MTFFQKYRVHFESVAVAIVLTALSYLVGSLLGWLSAGINWLEVFAVFTSYAATYLSVKQKRINYVWGAISSAAYAVLFFQYGLIASALLNAYLAPSLVFGWFRWRRDSITRPVEHVKVKMLWVYGLVTVVAYFGAFGLIVLFKGTFGPFDAIILAGTILAQLLLDTKKLETWIIWAVVNVVAIYVYFSSGLPLAGFQYVFFLANTVYGFVSWRNTMAKRIKPERTPTQEIRLPGDGGTFVPTGSIPVQPAASAVLDE